MTHALTVRNSEVRRHIVWMSGIQMFNDPCARRWKFKYMVTHGLAVINVDNFII